MQLPKTRPLPNQRTTKEAKMTTHTYNEIINSAKKCTNNVSKNYKLGVNSKWAYYYAKSILNPKKDIKKIGFNKASKPTGTSISRQITKNDYTDIAKRLIAYVEKHHQLPNYITYGKYRIRTRLYTLMFAKILVSYHKNNKLPDTVNVNNKAFTKPVETKNEVYNHFIDVFGNFGNTIDGALSKIAGKGYGYYYDDVYTNKEAINRMRNGKGVNCTDSCQVFYNIMQQLIALKKYKKVECLHVKCSGGDGHVRLRITLNDGTQIYRDPAAVLDSGSVTYNWCTNNYTLLAINPSWFLANLNR